MGRMTGLPTWGPAGWTFLHVASWTYPVVPTETQRREMFTFLHAFAAVLPCMLCREHWQRYLRETLPDATSPHLASREALTRYLVDAHNDVNRRLGKAEFSYAAAQQLYDPAVAPPRAPAPAPCVCALLGAVLLVVLGVGVASRLRGVRRLRCQDKANVRFFGAQRVVHN